MSGYEYGDWKNNIGILPVKEGTLVEVEFDVGRTIVTNLPEKLDWEIFLVDLDGENITRYRLLRRVE